MILLKILSVLFIFTVGMTIAASFSYLMGVLLSFSAGMDFTFLDALCFVFLFPVTAGLLGSFIVTGICIYVVIHKEVKP